MKKLIYKGHEVTIFETYNGDEIFIYKGEVKFYSARVCKGQAETRMRDILG